jgi:hypothetical protein
MSDKPKAQDQIDRVLGSEEVQPEGKKYKIKTFTCDGYINGEPVSGFLVKAIGKEKYEAVKPGLSFEADVDTYYGKTKYEIPRDFKPTTQGFTSPAPQSPGQAARQPDRATGGQAMSVEDFDSLFRHGMDVVSAKMTELRITEGTTPEDQGPASEPFSKLVSTYIIACMDNGIRMKKEPAEQKQEEVPIDMRQVMEVLEKKGLLGRVENAGIGEDDLANMWKASSASPLKFGMLVKEVLEKKEGGATEDIPF